MKVKKYSCLVLHQTQKDETVVKNRFNSDMQMANGYRAQECLCLFRCVFPSHWTSGNKNHVVMVVFNVITLVCFFLTWQDWEQKQGQLKREQARVEGRKRRPNVKRIVSVENKGLEYQCQNRSTTGIVLSERWIKASVHIENDSIVSQSIDYLLVNLIWGSL